MFRTRRYYSIFTVITSIYYVASLPSVFKRSGRRPATLLFQKSNQAMVPSQPGAAKDIRPCFQRLCKNKDVHQMQENHGETRNGKDRKGNEG